MRVIRFAYIAKIIEKFDARNKKIDVVPRPGGVYLREHNPHPVYVAVVTSPVPPDNLLIGVTCGSTGGVNVRALHSKSRKEGVIRI